MQFVFSYLRTCLERSARKLCKTSQCRSITYDDLRSGDRPRLNTLQLCSSDYGDRQAKLRALEGNLRRLAAEFLPIERPHFALEVPFVTVDREEPLGERD